MDSLSQPAAASMRSIEVLNAEDSLERAARAIQQNGWPLLPIQRNGALLGVVSERSLADALGNGRSPYDAAELALDASPMTIQGHATGAEALRVLNETGAPALVVLDPANRILGILTASDLFPKRGFAPRPPMVGGMATPFGVYLTTGSIGAGVGPLALVSTGAAMFLLFQIAGIATWLIQGWGTQHGFNLNDAAQGGLLFGLFLVGMRLLPLSGIHAAEHKVVHAIERGEALVPEVVGRMPRVHPRCGTNIAVALAIFVGVTFTEWVPDPYLRAVVAGVATLSFWRPLGNLTQWLVTTRPPSRKHIEMGIRSGKALLEQYRVTRAVSANPFQRIWHSGILHVMTGGVLCTLVLKGLQLVFKFNFPVLV